MAQASQSGYAVDYVTQSAQGGFPGSFLNQNSQAGFSRFGAGSDFMSQVCNSIYCFGCSEVEVVSSLFYCYLDILCCYLALEKVLIFFASFDFSCF